MIEILSETHWMTEGGSSVRLLSNVDVVVPCRTISSSVAIIAGMKRAEK